MKGLPWRAWLRQVVRAESSVLAWAGLPGFGCYGYFVPYSLAGKHPRPRPEETVPWLEARLDAGLALFLEYVAHADRLDKQLAEFAHADPTDPSRPRFDQSWFSGIDATILYAMVHRHRPARVIEVGSGHSTRFIARAARDAGCSAAIHSIDPHPRRDVDALCASVSRISVTRVTPEEFDSLGANDVLFIDGSHVAMPGTDVDFLVTRILPRLRRGVLVHFHDVFLPYGYPDRWPWTQYNEQQALLAVLGGGDRYRILWPSAWMRRAHAEKLTGLFAPLGTGAEESSFWLRVEN